MKNECRECFARTYIGLGLGCQILTEYPAYEDKHCPFFKTKEQDVKDRKKAEDRVRFLGIKRGV